MVVRAGMGGEGSGVVDEGDAVKRVGSLQRVC